MSDDKTSTTAETYTLRSGRAAEAAEHMALARGNGDARTAYARVLVEESKSFGAYVSRKIGTRLKKAS